MHGTVLAAANDLPPAFRWFYYLGRWVVDDFGSIITQAFAGDRVVKAVVFLLLLVVGYGLGKGIANALRRTMLRPPRVDDAVGRLTAHLVVLAFVLLGFSIGLTLFGTSLAAMATALGLLTLALGFGMQNTVANLMGGISLAVDKPFRAGDRIEVGKYWGTVQTIGLRSTKILTPKKETVVVPNKIMEEREIWNYTISSPEYRLDLDLLISYDSDWRLAEKILLEVAKEHPNMLHYRPIHVFFRDFAESGVRLQLRTWIADVTLRAETTSDLLKSIKDRFDEAGIELPYPYRTVVYKKDLAKPARPKDAIQPYHRHNPDQRRVLILISDPHDADDLAFFSTSLSKALNAGVVGAYVSETPGRSWEAEHVLRLMRETSRAQRVWFKPIVRTGPLIETVRELVEEERIELVVVGEPRSRLAPWKRPRDIKNELRSALPCPIVTFPVSFKISPSYVTDLRERVQAYRDGSQPRQQVTLEPASNGSDVAAEIPLALEGRRDDEAGEHEAPGLQDDEGPLDDAPEPDA